MITASEMARQIMAERKTGVKYIHDWQDEIPWWSKWTPGSLGDPFHKPCLGLGKRRFDLPTGHPHFGELFPCNCVDHTAPETEYDRVPRKNRIIKDYGQLLQALLHDSTEIEYEEKEPTFDWQERQDK